MNPVGINRVYVSTKNFILLNANFIQTIYEPAKYGIKYWLLVCAEKNNLL